MFIKVKIQTSTKLSYLATTQTSTYQSAGVKSCANSACRTSKLFDVLLHWIKGSDESKY